jgi:hypothetical protein
LGFTHHDFTHLSPDLAPQKKNEAPRWEWSTPEQITLVK